MIINESYKTASTSEKLLSEHLYFHLNTGMNLIDSVFRYNSDSWIDLINETRKLVKESIISLTHPEDLELINSDAGKYGVFEGKKVPLDIPLIESELVLEAKDKQKKHPPLNKPKRNTGSGKKYVVYVKDPSTKNVKKITFGDVKGGLKSKINDPEARKAFAKRHNCSAKKDKTKPGYWACRLPRYAKSLGLAGSYTGYW